MVQPTAADYKATRADFKVKLTFSHGVSTPLMPVILQLTKLVMPMGLLRTAGAATGTVIEVANSGGKEFVAMFDVRRSSS